MTKELLPNNWLEITLGEVAVWSSGGTPSRAVPSYYNGHIPWVKTGDLNDSIITEVEENISEEGLTNSNAKIYPKNSVVIAMYGATIGKTGLLGINAATNQACAVAQPYPGINYKYLFHYLKSQKQNFIEKGKGGAQPNISQTVIKEHPFPLAPSNEQDRIANKVDLFFQNFDVLVSRLERVPQLINVFKERLLIKAFKGDLTKDWRNENRIVEEWRSLPVGEFMEEIKDRVEPSELVNEKIYIGLEHIAKDGILIGKGSSNEVKSSKTMFKSGDVLYGKLRPYLNKHVFVDFEGVCSTDILVYRNKNLYAAKWFNFFLSLPETIKKANADSKGINLPRISSSILNAYEIPIPTPDEQKEIVTIVEKLFLLIDSIQSRYTNLKISIDNLPSTILKKAFRGELVPHDENDEPVTELLNRIINARNIEAVKPIKAEFKPVKSEQMVSSTKSLEEEILLYFKKSTFSFEELKSKIPMRKYNDLKDEFFKLLDEKKLEATFNEKKEGQFFKLTK